MSFMGYLRKLMANNVWTTNEGFKKIFYVNTNDYNIFIENKNNLTLIFYSVDVVHIKKVNTLAN